ncbi:MAG: hypothetical protein LQ340_001674 [Diploschistes diacapsis]|nr:MAG: hypothetical protein LQ340_001674 [Diploschistes diacapsis]
MSADLWAAFADAPDDLSSNPWSQPSPTQASHRRDGFDHVDQSSSIDQQSSETEGKVHSTEQLQSPWASSHIISPISQPAFAIAEHKTNQWATYKPTYEADWSGSESPSVFGDIWTKAPSSPEPKLRTSHQTVELSSMEDWGDFETPADRISKDVSDLSLQAKQPQQGSSMQSAPTSSVSLRAGASEAIQRRNRGSVGRDPYTDFETIQNPLQQDKASLKDCQVIHPSDSLCERGTALVYEDAPYKEDEWGEWGELSPDPVSSSHFSEKETPVANNAVMNPEKHVQHGHDTLKSSSAANPKSQAPGEETGTAIPPTNVPPPSILMPLVSGLVEKLPLQVDNAMQNLPQPGESAKALETALRKCLASLRVAARITAGRKLRWKRDTHLAQSMRIGQAGKGMKLSGVDRNEIKREDREAAEFVHVWHKQLGSIRRALALVNNQISGSLLTLPEISVAMPIRTIRVADGGIPAPKCCVLCGLKREERVDKVDVDVYDAFNEWWTEHWGHTDCKIFWLEHERYLQHR